MLLFFQPCSLARHDCEISLAHGFHILLCCFDLLVFALTACTSNEHRRRKQAESTNHQTTLFTVPLSQHRQRKRSEWQVRVHSHTETLHNVPSSSGSCYLCESSGHGICINNNTACQCFAGFAGPSCLGMQLRAKEPHVSNDVSVAIDAVSIPSSGDASKNGAANWNIGAIIAGVLGGVLLTLIIVLIVFCCWKRRRDRKKNAIEFPLPSAPPKPVPVSSLYNVPLSEQYSSVSSTSTTTYHLYEELD